LLNARIDPGLARTPSSALAAPPGKRCNSKNVIIETMKTTAIAWPIRLTKNRVIYHLPVTTRGGHEPIEGNII
jgi:hypothetical protein